MSKEEYINKIVEMSMELLDITLKKASIEDLKELYIKTKVSYEITKEMDDIDEL